MVGLPTGDIVHVVYILHEQNHDVHVYLGCFDACTMMHECEHAWNMHPTSYFQKDSQLVMTM